MESKQKQISDAAAWTWIVCHTVIAFMIGVTVGLAWRKLIVWLL